MKHRIAVEARQAAPDDPRLAIDQRADAAISDKSEIKSLQWPTVLRALPATARSHVEEFSGPGRAVGRVGFARADLDRYAVPGVDENEGILVGDIVSGKNRPPAGERLLVEEIGDGCPLVAANGLCFDNHLAAFEFNAGQVVDRGLHQRNAGLLELGMRAVVQGDGAVFVFQEESRVLLQQRLQGVLDRRR